MKAFLPMQVFLTKVLKLGLTKKWSGMSLQHSIHSIQFIQFNSLSFTGISKMLSGPNILQNGWLYPIYFIRCYNVIHLVEICFDFCLQKYIFKTDQRKPSKRRHCIV